MGEWQVRPLLPLLSRRPFRAARPNVKIREIAGSANQVALSAITVPLHGRWGGPKARQRL
jgi:hypothetical protein